MVDLTVRITGDSRDVQTAAQQATAAMTGFSKSSQAAVSALQARIDAMVAKTKDVHILGQTASAKESASVFAEQLDRLEASAQRLKDQYNPLAAAQMKLTSQMAEYQMMATHGYLTTEELAKAQAAARAEFDKTAKAVKGHGASLEINRNQQMMYLHSAKALGEGIAAGQNPLTMGVQQGLEFLDALSMGEHGVMGSLTAIGNKLASVFTPGRLLIGATTAAALGLGYAFMQANKAVEDTDKSLETSKKLMEGVRKNYITNLPAKETELPPTKVDVLANLDDLTKNRRDQEAKLAALSGPLQAKAAMGLDYNNEASMLADIIDKAIKSRDFAGASERLYTYAKDNGATQDVAKVQSLITTLALLDQRTKQNETALASMSAATETTASRMKDVSDAMSRLHDAIPDVTAKLAYFGRIADIQKATAVAMQGASPQQQKEIASDSERAMKATTDEYAAKTGEKTLTDERAAGVDKGQISKLDTQLKIQLAAAQEETRRLFPDFKAPIKTGARTFEQQALARATDPALAAPGSSLYEKGVAVQLDLSSNSAAANDYYTKLLKSRGVSNPTKRFGDFALEQSVQEKQSEDFQAVFERNRESNLRSELLKSQAANVNRLGPQRATADLVAQNRMDLQRQNIPITPDIEAKINAAAAEETAAKARLAYAEMMKSSQDRLRVLEAEKTSYGLTAEAAAKLRYQTELLMEADRQGVDIDAQKAAAIDTVAARMAKIETETQKAREAQQGLGQAWQGLEGLATTSLQGMVDHTLTFKSALKSAIPVIIQLISSMAKMQQVNGTFGVSFGNPFGGGGGGGGGLGGFFGSILGGLFGVKSSGSAGPAMSLAPGGAPDYAGIYHDGGIVGSGLAPVRPIGVIPRYHSGNGLAPDEEFAILQKGERVIPENRFVDPPRFANTEPFGRQGALGGVIGMLRGGDTNVTINGNADRGTVNQLRDALEQRDQQNIREQQRNAGQIQANWKKNRG